MKNIAMFRRFGSENSRLYELPAGVEVHPGTIVTVDYVNGSTATAFAVSNSWNVDSLTEKMIADLFHFHSGTLDNLKKVRSIYTAEMVCAYEEELPEPEITLQLAGEG